MSELERSVNMAEPGDIEVLYFYAEAGGSSGVAPCQEAGSKLTSIIGTDRNNRFFHLLFSPKETRLMIAALQEVLKKTEPTP